jgi:hypothetical protein
MATKKNNKGWVIVDPKGNVWWAYAEDTKYRCIRHFMYHVDSNDINGWEPTWKNAYRTGFRVRRVAVVTASPIAMLDDGTVDIRRCFKGWEAIKDKYAHPGMDGDILLEVSGGGSKDVHDAKVIIEFLEQMLDEEG